MNIPKLHYLLGISDERVVELETRFVEIFVSSRREVDIIIAIEMEPGLSLRERLFMAEILGKTVEAGKVEG